MGVDALVWVVDSSWAGPIGTLAVEASLAEVAWCWLVVLAEVALAAGTSRIRLGPSALGADWTTLVCEHSDFASWGIHCDSEGVLRGAMACVWRHLGGVVCAVRPRAVGVLGAALVATGVTDSILAVRRWAVGVLGAVGNSTDGATA